MSNMEPSPVVDDDLAAILREAAAGQNADIMELLKNVENIPRALQIMREESIRKATFYKQLYFFGAITVMLSVFAFFGYKLYLSLTEKERKREEKLKAKQEKSKKKK